MVNKSLEPIAAPWAAPAQLFVMWQKKQSKGAKEVTCRKQSSLRIYREFGLIDGNAKLVKGGL